MQYIDKLDASSATVVLWELKKYAELRKKLGKRGRDLFHRKLSGQKYFAVEYAQSISEDMAWQYADWVFEKTFWCKAEKRQVVFVPRSSLKGWMKVYLDDMMVDVSFKKVEKHMQK